MPFLLIQYCSHLRCQGIYRKGFLDEVDTLIQHPFVRNDIIGLAGHINVCVKKKLGSGWELFLKIKFL